jgi:hypothetical protein
MLTTIDRNRLKPTPDSTVELESGILDGLPADDWLQAKLRSLQYADGYSFASMVS